MQPIPRFAIYIYYSYITYQYITCHNQLWPLWESPKKNAVTAVTPMSDERRMRIWQRSGKSQMRSLTARDDDVEKIYAPKFGSSALNSMKTYENSSLLSGWDWQQDKLNFTVEKLWRDWQRHSIYHVAPPLAKTSTKPGCAEFILYHCPKKGDETPSKTS